MTIDEAKTILTAEEGWKRGLGQARRADAIRLGIEALERVKQDRYYEIASQKPLPGETAN